MGTGGAGILQTTHNQRNMTGMARLLRLDECLETVSPNEYGPTRANEKGREFNRLVKGLFHPKTNIRAGWVELAMTQPTLSRGLQCQRIRHG